MPAMDTRRPLPLQAAAAGLKKSKSMLLMINVDDVSGETISHVIDELMAEGAASVHVVPAITKKGRPEYLFYVDAPENRLDAIGTYFARELGTIGMRIIETRHVPFQYRMNGVRISDADAPEDPATDVRVKQVLNNDGQVVSVKADYEDIKTALARLRRSGRCKTLSFTTLKGLAEQTVLGRRDTALGNIKAMYTGDSDK